MIAQEKARASEEAPRPAVETTRGVADNVGFCRRNIKTRRHDANPLLSGHRVPAYSPRSRSAALGARAFAVSRAGRRSRVLASPSSRPSPIPAIDLPLTASGMEDAARASLADPDDPGGRAGCTVVKGTLTRPERPVGATDPEVRCVGSIAGNPEKAAHRADGLASGGVTNLARGTRTRACFRTMPAIAHR